MSDQPEKAPEQHDPYSTSGEAVAPPPGVSTVTFYPDEAAGTMIGPYKLLQQLGRGGMGVVWMAEQREPVQRYVAIKIVKSTLHGSQVVARFEAERQALAMMDHPNVAKVLDAGATAAGRPYFVMELVKGISFTQYCDNEKLPLKDRLELFIPVCNAVQHAHQKGVVHRDLKPSNVLIALYDGKPVPKVIDFGVAKATHQKLTEKTMFTEVGQIVGTLEYMAPEQAELNNLDIDTRADIYSLGVMLYEILTGSPPFSRKDLQSGAFDEMLRMIREKEPSKPSTKISLSQELPSIAAKRKLEPKSLTRFVRGDLDWIVMKCLEKERARRYDSANQLGEELRRFLCDEPVQAGPPSLSYRARKFMRRNRGPVVAATLVALALVGGIIGTSVGLLEAERARDAAEKATKKEQLATKAALDAIGAERQAKFTAQQRWQHIERTYDALLTTVDVLIPKTNFMMGGFVVPVDWKDVEKQLDQMSSLMDGDGTGTPLMVAKMQSRLGEHHLQNRNPEKAIGLLGRALSAQKKGLADGHPDTLRTARSLADAYMGAGRYKEAIPLWEYSLSKEADLKPGDLKPGGFGDFSEVTIRDQLAWAHELSGNHTRAFEIKSQLIEEASAELGPTHRVTEARMKSLALGQIYAKRGAEAVLLFQRLLDNGRMRFPGGDSENLTRMGDLARAYLCAGNPAEGLKLYKERIDLARKKGDGELAGELSSAAIDLLHYSYPGAAEPFLLESVKIRMRSNPDDWSTFSETFALGESILGQKRYADAEKTLKKGWEGIVSRQKDIPPFMFEFLGRNLQRVVKLYKAGGKNEEANYWRLRLNLISCRQGETFEFGIRDQLKSCAEDFPDSWLKYDMSAILGSNLLGQKKYKDADPLLKEGYIGMKRREKTIPPEGKVRLTEALERLVQLYEATGNAAEAERYRKELARRKAAEKSKK